MTPIMDKLDATFAGRDPEVALPPVTCPVLPLQGDPAYGGLMADEELERALRLLPRAAHVEVKGVGHGAHRERPEAVVRMVAAFLDLC
jgi:pimeloyl-ACP methyl ester carboxylesterase